MGNGEYLLEDGELVLVRTRLTEFTEKLLLYPFPQRFSTADSHLGGSLSLVGSDEPSIRFDRAIHRTACGPSSHETECESIGKPESQLRYGDLFLSLAVGHNQSAPKASTRSKAAPTPERSGARTGDKTSASEPNVASHYWPPPARSRSSTGSDERSYIDLAGCRQRP